MRVLVSYDLSGGWAEVGRVAAANGFYNVLSTVAGQKQAPQTVMFLNDHSTRDAVNLFTLVVQRAATNLGTPIAIRRLVAARIAEDWLIRSDAP